MTYIIAIVLSMLENFFASLPKLTEKDLIELNEAGPRPFLAHALESGCNVLRLIFRIDSSCPICLTSFMAIVAEEEMALAMDSPANPVEQLGVTRLVATCGHVFCRKELSDGASTMSSTS